MSIKEIFVPDIGDVDRVEIIEVLVASGDAVQLEDSLITVESDKASMEIPSPIAGVVKEVKVQVGDEVQEGNLILTLELSDAPSEAQTDEESASSKDAVKAESEVEQQPSTTVVPPKDKVLAEVPVKQDRVQPDGSPTKHIDSEHFKQAHASPAIRKMARELGVDLSKVAGTGRKGRISKEDLKLFVKSKMQGQSNAAPSHSGSGIPAMPEIDFTPFGQTDVIELTKINRLTGEFLHRNWLNIPHVTQFDYADITDMEAFRKQTNEEQVKAGKGKLTPLVFIMKAVVSALQKYPRFNTSLSASGQQLIQKHYYHIGIAVDTPNGLVVPVIRDVDQKSLNELNEELKTVSAKARDKKLSPSDMQGGCFSISSLGGIGGSFFTPIVNAPEVAILGVSRSEMQPVWNGQEFAPRLRLPLALSYDHRVIDGADGARFTSYLAALLSDIRRLLV